MARVLFILGLAAITVYALADWAARSQKWTPGRLNRWVWLAVILLIPGVGPLAWIITGLVTRAEERQGRPTYEPEPEMRAPDDNPSAVADVADRIARRQKRTRGPRPQPPEEKGQGKGQKRGEDLPGDNEDDEGTPPGPSK